MRGRLQDDHGQLMMLAGIVLTISFILTALTLAQVSALEREAAASKAPPIVGEWRFLHAKLDSNLQAAVAPETSNNSLIGTVVPTIAATFRGLQAEKGYDFTLRLAGGPAYEATGNEAALDVGNDGDYDAWTYDGAVQFTHAVDAEDSNGMLWQAPCPDPAGAQSGCIVGVYLYARLADGSSSIEESILFAVNQP